MYEVSVRAGTSSIYDQDRTVYFGRRSHRQKIHLRENCDQVQAFTVLGSGDSASSSSSSSSSAAAAAESSSLEPLLDVGTGAVAGASLVAFLLVLAVVAVVLKRYSLQKHIRQFPKKYSGISFLR